MMKKVIITVLVIVTLLAGTAGVLVACDKYAKSAETEVETVSVVESKIDEINEDTNELVNYIVGMYVSAAEEIYGDDFDDTKATYDNKGITYEGRFVSWEYLEETAYNSMMNQL